MKKIKKIFLVTSNRSEYGIMRNLIKDFKKSKKLRLYLIATGSHLNNFFGYTIKEIIKLFMAPRLPKKEKNYLMRV